jgi:hypothetical protein
MTKKIFRARQEPLNLNMDRLEADETVDLIEQWRRNLDVWRADYLA